MQVKVNEEFYRKRSYTHRYDHLHDKLWELIEIPNEQSSLYVIKYHDIVEYVNRDEFVIHPAKDMYVS